MATLLDQDTAPVVCSICEQEVDIAGVGWGALAGDPLHMGCYRRSFPLGHLTPDLERDAIAAEGADRGVCPRCDQPGEIVRVANFEHIACHGCRTRWRNRGEAVTAPVSMAQSAKNARVIEDYRKIEPKGHAAGPCHGSNMNEVKL